MTNTHVHGYTTPIGVNTCKYLNLQAENIWVQIIFQGHGKEKKKIKSYDRLQYTYRLQVWWLWLRPTPMWKSAWPTCKQNHQYMTNNTDSAVVVTEMEIKGISPCKRRHTCRCRSSGSVRIPPGDSSCWCPSSWYGVLMVEPGRLQRCVTRYAEAGGEPQVVQSFFLL